MCGDVVFVSKFIFFFVDESEFGLFVSCCVGSFGGWCRRRSFVILIDCSYVTHGGIVRSVHRGLFLVSDVAGLCTCRGVHWVVDRVVYDVGCVGMGAA